MRPVNFTSSQSLPTANESLGLSSRTLALLMTRMSEEVGLEMTVVRIMSSMELTLDETAFRVTFMSPLDRPRARVVRLRGIAERNMV